MSSILDALKKLESEKIARDPQQIRISAEILRDGSRPERSPLRSIWAVLAIFACGGAAVYLVLTYYPFITGARENVKIVTHTPRPLPFSDKSPERSPVRVPVERISPETIIAAPPEPLQHDSQKTPRALKNQATIKANTQVLEGKKSKSTTQKRQHDATSSLPLLKVNGIAFQDGQENVAVVNGTPVGRGTIIDGVRVDEIQRDQVTFSKNGRTFSIMLGTSNQ